MKVIAIHGKMGSGKSTAAKYIRRHTMAVIKPFAKPIKDLAYYIGWDGLKDTKGRRLLQLLGTEVGRECIHPNIWVDKWQESLEDTGSYVVVICDDLRFQNEYAHLDTLKDVTLIHIVRKTEATWFQRLVAWLRPTHKSERGIDFNLELQPYLVENDGTLEELYRKLDGLI